MADRRTTESSPAPQANGQVILVLRNLLEERYPDLGAHVNTVSTLSEIVGSEVGLADEEVDALKQAALLHDIGKLALPESILARPGPLDKDEWRVIRQHTVVGAGILIAAGLRGKVVDFVRSSHERVDGSGYPEGLVGERIPLGARVIAVCDAYDAMTSPRPYRPVPMSSDGASLELMRSSGTQFDTAVVDVLCQMLLRRSPPPVVRAAAS
jgi:two-component system, cell cycle response regulator